MTTVEFREIIYALAEVTEGEDHDILDHVACAMGNVPGVFWLPRTFNYQLLERASNAAEGRGQLRLAKKARIMAQKRMVYDLPREREAKAISDKRVWSFEETEHRGFDLKKLPPHLHMLQNHAGVWFDE